MEDGYSIRITARAECDLQRSLEKFATACVDLAFAGVTFGDMPLRSIRRSHVEARSNEPGRPFVA